MCRWVWLVFWMWAFAANAQERSLEWRSGFQQVQELNLMPKVHRGVGHEVHFVRKTESNRVQVAVGFSSLRTSWEPAGSSYLASLQVGYEHLWVALSKGQFVWKTGAALDARYVLSFFPNWDESHLYRANGWGALWANRFTFQSPSAGTWQMNWQVPLAGAISRPQWNRPYKIDDVSAGGILKSQHQRMEWAGWGKWLGVELCLEWRRQSPNAWLYAFRWDRLRARDGEPFLNIQHQLGYRRYL